MADQDQPASLAVLTSGGDAPGMNAAVRAVVRSALHRGVDVYAVHEGYQGMVDGGDLIQRMTFDDVGGILQRGGTVIGSARSQEFRTRPGRRRAAGNLVDRGIDALVVVGGDGSLTGAELFRREWPELLAELAGEDVITGEQARAHPRLRLAGLAGSIDNDMFGTDMTIGADTALHRITEAVDAIHSTAASHQRAFVIEVMGRNCGYLALMGALATGANWVLVPEHPPDTDDWQEAMCSSLRSGREIGRRQTLVVVAEGAHDRDGKPITVEEVKHALETRLGEDTRVTILGHVQRGGAPSAFDRNLSTLLGHAAVDHVRSSSAQDEAHLVGIRGNRIVRSPLMQCVERTHAVADLIAARDYDAAMDMRGGNFKESLQTFETMVRARPRGSLSGRQALRLAVLHAGGLAPGMNTAVRAAIRVGMDGGHTMLAVHNGFEGLKDGAFEEMDWMSVSGWVSLGGAELGTSRFVPGADDLDAIAGALGERSVDGLLMIGGWAGYEAAHTLHARRHETPAFDIPIVCLPASINNDLPGSEFSVGTDTALNNIVSDVDKIKETAVATRRCFVVEVMGHDCGYLAFMGGLATGAERAYLPEEGIALADLQADVEALTIGFEHGKRLGLVIRSEGAEEAFSVDFITALFEKEGGDLFDVREAILGHVQQGGIPSPFDRIQATRLATRSVDFLVEQAGRDRPAGALIGLREGRVAFTDLADLWPLSERGAQRPAEQWWMELRPLAAVMAGSPYER